MAMHYWNGSSWQIVNNSHDPSYGPEDNKTFRIWTGLWQYVNNAKIWNGSTWKGFLDQVQISDDFATNIQGGGGANAEWAIYSTGDVIFTQDNSFMTYEWIINPSNSNQYEIFVTQSSGSLLDNTSSPLDTWLDLASTHVWRVFANDFNETVQAALVAEIRHKITQQSVAMNYFQLYATTTGNPGFPI